MPSQTWTQCKCDQRTKTMKFENCKACLMENYPFTPPPPPPSPPPSFNSQYSIGGWVREEKIWGFWRFRPGIKQMISYAHSFGMTLPSFFHLSCSSTLQYTVPLFDPLVLYCVTSVTSFDRRATFILYLLSYDMGRPSLQDVFFFDESSSKSNKKKVSDADSRKAH